MEEGIKMTKLTPFIITLLVLIGCAKEKEMTRLLQVEERSFFKEGCIDASCAKLDFNWVEYAGDERADRMNEILEQQILSYTQFGELKFTCLDTAADFFIAQYKSVRTEFPDSPGDWYLALNSQEAFDSLGLKTLVYQMESYTGGAHGNTSFQMLNFDAASGNQLSNDALILDNDRLLNLAEEAFRKYHEVDPALTLEEDGDFFLPETGFFLPATMGYSGSDFILYYQSYEIGPYAMGTTDLRIPLKELKGVVHLGPTDQ